MSRLKSGALLVVFLAGFALYAQESQLPPFVSRLTAVTEEDGIRLSWQDSDEAEGNYFVYAHSEEITETNLSNARLLATIEPGVEEYFDAPESEGPHYYAVLASNAEGEKYEFFVPYRNKTTRGVRFAPPEETERVITPITGISAEVDEEQVELSFSATVGEEVVVYRSTETLTSADDLVNAVLVESVPHAREPYVDKPMAGISYYYGVFYDKALRTGSAVFELGENVLLTPIQIRLAESSQIGEVEPVRRVRPLPYLMLSSTIDSGEELKAGPYDAPSRTVTLSEDTMASVDKLLSGRERPAYGEMDPMWLSGKANGPLEKLLEEPFEDGRWEDALDIISTYTRTRRTPAEKQRANFYEGQSLYFLGQYQEAFMRFIFAEDAYYTDVQPWLDDIISLLASE